MPDPIEKTRPSLWIATVYPKAAPRRPGLKADGAVPNVAVTEVLEFSATLQVPVPEQPPLQPEKFAPLAVKVITVPFAKEALQVAPQLIPAGLEVTDPAPASTTESVGSANVADTAVLALSVSVQVVAAPVEAQASPHALNNEVAAGVATSVRAVPDG
jgi:hypothetical protein